MKHHFPRTALLVSLVAAACSAHAASTRTVSIEKEADQATSIETRHAGRAGVAPNLFTTHYFTGGAMMMAWGDQRVLLLCKKSAYLKLPGMKPAASELPLEKRQMVGYEAMMAGYGGIAAIGGLVDGSIAVADDGSEVRRQAERSWAYGIERYDVISQRMPDGALRVRALKTATVNNAKPSKPGDRFSTDEDQAARLAELGAVGSWTEITMYNTPKRGEVDPDFSLKDWVSVTGDHAATVAEARRVNGCP
ncbi:TPA: hypothetical protein QDZ34_000080 [Stenotrophomonas maltophilia]|nr:hypothetical protein [Stenotrophomonas maltophilia]HDS1024016.1 hypothetical protein [Stenotrophomonas maltophilia]HDS1029298.1 hypothetical protein [Stenotrophomonas maltophilia]HDS1032779.1 hypothetical protein [Stenotrophomonas maltophilia]